MYKDNVVPTTASLKEKLNISGYDINYCDETFRQYLRSIGFCYKTLDKRMAIMESPRLKKERMEYIKKIKNYRNKGYQII